jgi:hypothetical protein
MFHSLTEYLDWYVESCSVINKADAQDNVVSSCEYDPAMRRLLEELIEFYSPLRFVTKQQFVVIYQSVTSLYSECTSDDGTFQYAEDGDVKELARNIEGLMSLYQGLFDGGQICEPIRTPEMARRLGISPRTLVIKLNKYPPPVQYAWKLTKVRGDWRFDPAQLDNFKRWLGNLEDPMPGEVGMDVTSLVKPPLR